MPETMTVIERIATAPRSRTRARAAQELLDYAFEVQDVVLDRQWKWLNELPVDDELRSLLFRRLCATTGQLIDSLFLPTERVGR